MWPLLWAARRRETYRLWKAAQTRKGTVLGLQEAAKYIKCSSLAATFHPIELHYKQNFELTLTLSQSPCLRCYTQLLCFFIF
jgi:hypothetical protein